MTAKEFRAIRERLGLTQPELAEILGLSSYMPVNHYESGFRRPSTLIMGLMRVFDEWPDKRSQELRESLKAYVCKERERSKKGS